MTAPNPSDLLTAALIAQETYSRLHEKWLHSDPEVTKARVNAALDDYTDKKLAAYLAVGRLAGVSS